MREPTYNPYAPPEAEVEHFPDQAMDIWRDDKLLVLRPDADLPDRCITCNQSAERVRQRSIIYAYHWGAIVLIVVLLLAFLPIGLLVALLLRKRAQVTYGLCPRHRRMRFKLGAAAVAFMLLAIVVVFALGSGILIADSGLLVGVSVSSFAIALILALIRGQPVRGKKITDEYWVLKGPRAPFLESLPKFKGNV